MRRSATLALPLTVALVAAGCGGSSSGGSKNNTNTGKPAAISLPASDLNPKSADQIKDGGTIIWSTETFGPQFNYNQVDGTEGSLAEIDNAVLPNPTLVDPQGNISYDPAFWTSVQQTSTTPQTIEYKLNPKAKWSNGKAITAADFIAQWKAITNPNFDVSGTNGYDQMSSVTQGSDQFDVIVKFKKAYSEWQPMFNPLYPASTNSTKSHFDNDYKFAIPITAGPFKFGSINKSAQTVTVVRDDSFWGTKAHLDKIVFKTLDSTASDQAFANGEIDVDRLIPNVASEYKLASGSQKGRVAVSTGPLQRQITLGNHGPLTDVNVRKAIAKGIDRLAISRSDLTGLPIKSDQVSALGNHFFIPGTKDYADNSGDVGKYDPAAANKLLDDAGWKKGSNGYRSKDGKELDLKVLIPAGTASTINEAKLLVPMMQQIGIKLTENTVPINDWSSKYLDKGNYDLAPFTWQGNEWPVGSSLAIYKCKGGENYSNICTPAIDQLLDTALAAPDRSGYAQNANSADKQIWDEAGTIMLFQKLDLEGVNKQLANIGAFGVASINYAAIGFVK